MPAKGTPAARPLEGTKHRWGWGHSAPQPVP